MAVARERLALNSLSATLVIADLPASSRIYVDGKLPVMRPAVPRAGGDNADNALLLGGFAVEAGRRHVRVEAFGYAPFEALVECSEGDTTLVRWAAPALPFEIRSITLSQDSWRPEFLRDGTEPGFFFTVETTAPGPISLEIRDAKNRPVALLETKTRRQKELLHWNGIGKDGKAVGAGIYRARLEGFETTLEMTILPAVADSSPSAPPSALSGFTISGCRNPEDAPSSGGALPVSGGERWHTRAPHEYLMRCPWVPPAAGTCLDLRGCVSQSSSAKT